MGRLTLVTVTLVFEPVHVTGDLLPLPVVPASLFPPLLPPVEPLDAVETFSAGASALSPSVLSPSVFPASLPVSGVVVELAAGAAAPALPSFPVSSPLQAVSERAARRAVAARAVVRMWLRMVVLPVCGPVMSFGQLWQIRTMTIAVDTITTPMATASTSSMRKWIRTALSRWSLRCVHSLRGVGFRPQRRTAHWGCWNGCAYCDLGRFHVPGTVFRDGPGGGTLQWRRRRPWSSRLC